MQLRSGFLCIFVLLALTACATKLAVVQLPQREADLYPLSRTLADVTVAIDEFSTPDRTRRYFGKNLIKKGILPIQIIVSNHSPHSYRISPLDVLLRKGTQIIDPLPIESVATIVKPGSWRMRKKSIRRVDEYFSSLAFTETVLAPGDSHQGVLFFPALKEKSQNDWDFQTLSLFQKRLKLNVVVTNLQTNQRVHFNTFSLTKPHEIQYYLPD